MEYFFPHPGLLNTTGGTAYLLESGFPALWAPVILVLLVLVWHSCSENMLVTYADMPLAFLRVACAQDLLDHVKGRRPEIVIVLPCWPTASAEEALVPVEVTVLDLMALFFCHTDKAVLQH